MMRRRPITLISFVSPSVARNGRCFCGYSRYATRFGERVEVLARHAATGASAGHGREVDARFLRPAANRRRRHDAGTIGRLLACRCRHLRLCRAAAAIAAGGRRRCFGHGRVVRIGFINDERRTYRNDVARFTSQLYDRPGNGRRQLDCRFVGHHGTDDVFFRNVVADFDKPLSNFGFDGSLAEVRQLEDVLAHSTSIMRLMPAIMRFLPGKYCHSNACGYGVSQPAIRAIGASRL